MFEHVCSLPLIFGGLSYRKMAKGRPSTFIMRVSDDEIDDLDDSDDEATSASLVTRRNFNFNNLYMRYCCAVLLGLI